MLKSERPVQWAAILLAAGQGRRFGKPKQFVDLGGRSVLAWSLELFASMVEVREMIVVVGPQMVERIEPLVSEIFAGRRASVVAGGTTRQESASAGLRALSEPPFDGVLIHDAARPFLRANDVRGGMRMVRPGRAALLGVPIVDTVKMVNPEGRVLRTLDRSVLWAAQTPQFATVADMRRAYLEAERAAFTATDDAALLAQAGVEIVVAPSHAENFKITTPEDLAWAEALLRRSEPSSPHEPART